MLYNIGQKECVVVSTAELESLDVCKVKSANSSVWRSRTVSRWGAVVVQEFCQTKRGSPNENHGCSPLVARCRRTQTVYPKVDTNKSCVLACPGRHKHRPEAAHLFRYYVSAYALLRGAPALALCFLADSIQVSVDTVDSAGDTQDGLPK